MLSEQIKLIRQKAFLSQVAFAKEIGVAYSTINRWETGKSKPNLSAMKSLKDYCQTNYLSFDEIEKEWFAQSSQEVKNEIH